MNLYRLDYESPDGSLSPVPERSIIRGNRDYLTHCYANARRDALNYANATGSVVRITRISGGGQMKAVARASGETHRIHRVKK